MLKLKRVYEAPAEDDGYRVLVDRIWPRGIKKVDAKLDLWLKAVAPSTELRKWFHHEPAKFPEFKQRYEQELTESPAKEAVEELKAIIAKEPVVTLLYGAKDQKDNQAVVLKDYLTGGAK